VGRPKKIDRRKFRFVAHGYKFVLRHQPFTAAFGKGIIMVSLPKVSTWMELLDTIIHEEFHRAISAVAVTTEKQDHAVMRRVFFD
jgi:hypothetical protein